MWNFQRIICIWICCVSCMFGTTQLSSLVQAVPYEYFDDHEQSFYDLDTEQIQAKYDTRLLSKQMLRTEQYQQQQQQQQHLENSKDFHNPESMERVVNRKPHDAATLYVLTSTTKLKSNDGRKMNVGAGDDDDVEHNDWQEETATKAAAALTSTITETLDELHLPRAASCFTNGQKFTHGQKVPRLDNCEVCLCMDGEIFCWWEKCDKKATKASTTYDDYSTPFEESSTTRIQLNPKSTFKTTLKPIKRPEISEDYKYDDDDSAEIRAIQQEYEGLRQQQMIRNEQEAEQHKIHHNKQIAKKIMFQGQEKPKQNKHFKEENKSKKKQEGQQQNYKQEKQYKTNEHFEQHHNTRNHNNNNNKNRNNKHDYSLSSSSSKILNFPENLPSVLYYDYKTEEHHQHQHQHREQHLKHQKQKQKQQQQQLHLQQHEKGLKFQQQQKQQQQQHVSRIHEYGQDFNTYSSSSTVAKTLSDRTGRGSEGEGEVEISGSRAQAETNLHNSIDGSSTTLKYFSNGNDNIYNYNRESEADSDILPEPPTKKSKFLTSIIDTGATEKTTEIPISQLNDQRSSMMATTAGTIAKSTTSTNTLKNTPPSASMPIKNQNFSPWDYNKASRDKIDKSRNYGYDNNNNNESSEDRKGTDEQDDAFHRWLTSTETNNKNNFTFNDAIIGRDDGGLDVVSSAGSLDSSNNDFNVEDRNYENIEPEIDTGLAVIKTKTKATIKPLVMMGVATTTTINGFDMVEKIRGGGGGEQAPAAVYNENSQKQTNEQNFSDNNSFNNNDNNTNSNNMANNNEIINSSGKKSNNNNSNNLSFNNNYHEDYYLNKDNIDRTTSSSRRISSSSSSIASNEDSGVAGVVNIDILLTASSANAQQQKPQQTSIETTNQLQQLQLQNFKNEKQIAKTQLKFIQPSVLTSNTNDVDNNNPLYSIINDNTRNLSTNSNDIYNNTYNIVGDGLNIEEQTQLQNMGVNFSSSNNNNNNNNNNSYSLSSSSDNFKFSHISAVVSKTNATSALEGVAAETETQTTTAKITPPPLSTTSSPERQCNVMGTMYKIGDILPQDTGNCLQCICIDGSTSDDTPRVTCSPHNCPPLVLPDLFDATGY